MNASVRSTPIQEVHETFFSDKNVRLFIKRDDLIHPSISGNKWRKLKYNLEEAKNQNKKTLLTFGGAYSNHIYAVAAAGKEYGLDTIGIIRGEKMEPLNAILTFALECGMMLHYINREEYRNKEKTEFIERLKRKFGDFYLLPEGGTNLLAVKGCAEIISEIDMDYNTICCPCGTGGTLAGLIAGNEGKGMIAGFSVLKGMKEMEKNVMHLLMDYCGKNFSNWFVNHDYHFGGYAKVNNELLSFIREFQSTNKILLDPVYTGKMMYGIYDLIKKDFFKPGSIVLAVHTGGLQGWEGMTMSIQQ